MTSRLARGVCVAGDLSFDDYRSPKILTPRKHKSQVRSNSGSLEGSPLAGDHAGCGFCFGQGSRVDFLWFRTSHLWPHQTVGMSGQPWLGCCFGRQCPLAA